MDAAIHSWLAIGGLAIAALTQDEWIGHYVALALRRRALREQGAAAPPPVYSSANGHVISRAARDPDFRQCLDEMAALDADGMSLVLASRLLHDAPLPERCATTDLFHPLARAFEAHGLSFYLLGGQEDVNRDAACRLRRLYPRLRLAGRHHGYFAPEDVPELLAAIDDAAPDILWIGLGVPLEQHFALRYRGQLPNVGLIKTCGGLFDFLAGRRSRAPRWMQAYGLEWFYRMMLEPRRLFWRYCLTNPHAIWLMLTASGPSHGRPPASGFPRQDGRAASDLDGRRIPL